MSEPMVVSTAAFVAVTTLVLLLATVLGRRSAEVERRLASHAVPVDQAEAKRRQSIDVLKTRRFSSMPAANAILGRLRPTETAAIELERAGISTTVARYLLLRVLSGALVFTAIQGLTGQILFALVGAVVGLMFPRFWLRRRGRKRLLAFEAQLAESIDLLVGSLRAGHGFLQGLESVSSQIEEPTKSELGRVLEQVNVGVNPVDALVAMSERIPSYDLALLVSAISVQRQTGGNLAEVLENLAATIRERRRIRGEVMALTTGPRVSGYVLGAIPLCLFLYFIAISSDYRDVMLGTTYGHILLAAAGVLSFLGYFFARQVSKVEY